MNYYFLLLALIASIIPQESESVCVSRQTDWGQFGSFFTDPLCDVWCRIRRCGEGVCRESKNERNRANCVCEKCYRDDWGNVIYSQDDYYEPSRLNFDRTSASPSRSQNQRSQDNLYPSQNNYNTDNFAI
ncbi:unnamed protein product [Caenorhabditis sp. 36 PRJEB53466]|nr:unnamed protein product [Caenorhabditis sp. 36 PRJEB53466]